MALTLVESAKLERDELRRGVIETFIWESLLLQQLPFQGVQGNAYKYNEEAALPGAEFRAVNAGYTESTGTFAQKTEALVIMGGDADVDRFIQQTRSSINDQRATQERLKVKSVTAKFQDGFVNGDVAVDANSFDGLKKRLTGNQVVDTPTANGSPVVGADDAARHTFLDSLDEALSRIDGDVDVLLMNKAIRTKLRSSARRLGFHAETTEAFGRTVDTYNGIPLVDIGKKADGTDIITVDETQGTSTNSSSIYGVKFSSSEAEPGVGGLNNGPLPIIDDLGMLETKPSFRTRIEMYVAIAVYGRGAVRLRGVLNA